MNSAEINSANRRLSDAAPADVARWADEQFGESSAATVSLQNPVLAHLLTEHAPSIPLVFIDTQYHFKATMDYKRQLEQRLGRVIGVIEPEVPKDDLWRHSTTACCQVRKVAPLQRFLSDRQGWVTGVRASDTVGRGAAHHVELDPRNDVVRVNPLLNVSEDEMASYIDRHELPRHPLTDLGYTSIGCWPCTTAVTLGEDSRAGRWRGEAKTECGLHYLYEHHSNL